MLQFTGNLPMQSDWPRPTCVVWCTASYVRVPDLDTMPERKIFKKAFQKCKNHKQNTAPVEGDKMI